MVVIVVQGSCDDPSDKREQMSKTFRMDTVAWPTLWGGGITEGSSNGVEVRGVALSKEIYVS